MGQFFGENIPAILKSSNTLLTLPATHEGQPARVRIGGQGYRWTSSLSLNTAIIGVGGLDAGVLAANTLYYVYLVVSNSSVFMVASTANPTAGPAGFTSWREIGRFRTFQYSAGIAAFTNRLLGGGVNPGLGGTTPVAYEPAFGSGFGTLASRIFMWQRIGGAIKIIGSWINGTVSAQTSAIGIPNSLTPCWSLLRSGNTPIGSWYRGISAVTQVNSGALLVNSSDTPLANMYMGGVFGGDNQNPFSINNVNMVMGNGETGGLEATIPIAEWQGLFD